MQVTTSDPIYFATKRWDEARNLLSDAVNDYLESCISLSTILGRNCPNGREIASHIDLALTSTHPAMRQKLARSTSALSQTRNRVASSIGCLPEELLCRIFFDVVYAPEHTELSMGTSVRAIYRSLHELLAVCSTWRNIMTSRGIFWRIIPAIDDPVRNQAIDLSLHRSRSCLLRLAGTTTLDGPPPLFKIIKENASRLSALNVQGSFSSQITSVVTELLRSGDLGQLCELSLRCSPPKYSQPSRVSNYILEAQSLEKDNFDALINSLSSMRLSGIQIHWETTSAFSDRLLELYIDKVGFGNSESVMLSFLSAVSSASKLRDLKIIDVRAYRIPAETTNLTMRPTVTLPKLESLLLQDLHFNVLEFFLLTISPGSYNSTVVLSSEVFSIIYSDGNSKRVDLNDVTRLLSVSSADVLFLPRGPTDYKPWLRGAEVRKLLEAMPKLKVLKMHGWHFYDEFCNNLCPPQTSESQTHSFSYPKLDILQLTGARIHNHERFKHVLVTLSPQSMILSGLIRSQGGNWEQITEEDDIADWLKDGVPGFRCVDLNYDAGSLRTGLWQLW
ncbi:unnamed protein product [Rhizoctonia solani]|uniref:F-box domain-containing protein n=1 Tax=Rhizoctonia solani TaxID=456999 RepID=A0A8H3HUB1_9AGAM|nr:unnamed protein product [Rhizoctonia solani]